MGLRSFIKRHDILYKPARIIRKAVRDSIRQIKVFGVAIRRGTLFSGLTSQLFSKSWEFQSFLDYSVSIPHCDSARDLIDYLTNTKLHFMTGRWTIYLPPQEGLEDLFPFLKSHYPPKVGIKLLKAIDHPKIVKYVYENYPSRPFHPFWNGDIPRLTRIANYLYRHDLGPRVFDVASMKSDTQAFTAFIIQHIDSEKLNAGDYEGFIDQLNAVFSRKEIIPTIQTWENHIDFSRPNCNGNLLRSSKDRNLYYVDFQSFMFKNEQNYIRNLVRQHRKTLHFGTEAALLGGRFLYQSIPSLDHGRRDTARRWKIFEELLNKVGLELQNKVIFDVCCNAGMILNHCLVNGAYWGIGWDLPAVADVARSLQSAFGMTRIDIVGEKISPDTDFVKDVPQHAAIKDDGILFYLAAKKHIGFPDGVGKLPWKTMIYEGHKSEDLEKTRELLNEVRWLRNATIEAITTNRSELGEIRTIAILTRPTAG